MEPDEQAVVELARETRSSIEVARLASGSYRWTVKVYFDAETEDAELDAIDMVHRIDMKLDTLFVVEKGDV